MNRISAEIIQCEHPMGFNADASKNRDYSVLKLVKNIMEMINGSGVKVELFLQLAERLLESFFLLIDDVIFQGTNQNFQV